MRRFELRYFNGRQWTADVSSSGQRMIDNGGPTTYQQGWGAASPAPRRPGRGFAIAAFVLAISALLVGWIPFIFALAAAAAIAAFVFAIVGIRRARDNEGHGKGLAVAAAIIAPIALGVCVVGFFLTRAVLREVQKFVDPGRYELVQNQPCAVDQGVVTFSGTITNTDVGDRGYTINVEFLDTSAGKPQQRLATDVVQVAPVPAGGSADWESVQLVSVGTDVSCSVTGVYGPTPFGLDGRSVIPPK